MRRQEERRVAPIDAGQRPRVRPGGRREQPEIEDEEGGHPGAREDFADELARREQEEETRVFPAAPEEAPQVSSRDRVEIHGREIAPSPAAPARQPEPPRPEGQHLDLKV